MSDHKFQGFVASLSNGETVFEGRGYSWEALVEYCRENKLRITRLRLQCSGLTIITPHNAEGYVESKVVNIKEDGVPVLKRGIGYVNYGHIVLAYVDGSRNVFIESISLSEQLAKEPGKVFLNGVKVYT